MIESIKSWIISVLIAAFIINMVDMILPTSKLKPYIKLVLNFIFVFIVISPIISFFSTDSNLEDKILKSMSEYNKKYVDSTNNLANITGQNDLAKGYENGLKEVIRLKLDEYGYELEEIELDGSEISNIKIKEKNSNNIKKEDIQSKEDEDTQVFKEKEKNEQLKDDLIKILDISIETIQID
jgi:stage III sporulation protein AF